MVVVSKKVQQQWNREVHSQTRPTTLASSVQVPSRLVLRTAGEAMSGDRLVLPKNIVTSRPFYCATQGTRLSWVCFSDAPCFSLLRIYTAHRQPSTAIL